MRGADDHAAKDGLDQFVPVRKSDIIEGLIKHGALAGEPECEQVSSALQIAGVDLSL